jgi:hypothetical protein
MAVKNFKHDDKDLPSEDWSEGGHAVDPEIERLWAQEAERRYQEFLDGKVQAIPGQEALRRIRATLR